MFVTEFGGPYRTSGLRPISIAMFDLIYVGKFESQYLEKDEGYKGQSFKPNRTCYPALDFVKKCGQHSPPCRRGGARNATFNENVEIVASFLRP